MSIPKYPDKHGKPAVFTARDLAGRRQDGDPAAVPAGIIITFQDHAYRYAVRKYRGRAGHAPYGEFARLRKTPGEIGVAGRFGIGAPAAVFTLEWLAALGARRILAIGYAGGLLERFNAGDLVVCSRALRDEGTSYHYVPPGDYAEPDRGLTSVFQAALTDLGYAHEIGPSWTTDAPLRETHAEIERYAGQGILTVEMEAAALFSASTAIGTACAAGFTIGDAPRRGRWLVGFDPEAVTTGLERLVDAAVEVLSTSND